MLVVGCGSPVDRGLRTLPDQVTQVTFTRDVEFRLMVDGSREVAQCIRLPNGERWIVIHYGEIRNLVGPASPRLLRQQIEQALDSARRQCLAQPQ